MAGLRVLVTGAGGKLGSTLLPLLAAAGHSVVGTDVVRGKKIRRLPEGVALSLCDLRDGEAVSRLVEAARPDVVVHTAAIVAPVAYALPALAREVNVEGSRHLIAATRQHAKGAHFIFVSSFAAHGFCGPKMRQPLAAGSALTATCNYGAHKVLIERELVASGLSHSILCLGGVFDPHDIIPPHPSFKPFSFMIPLDQPEHGVHVADVARAATHAVDARLEGKRLMIAGDSSWVTSAREMRALAFEAMGLSLPRDEAFRVPPAGAGPEGWFCEGEMHTERSQSLLDFQRISLPEMVAELAHAARFQRPLLRLLGPPVQFALRRESPYLGRDAIEPSARLWDDLKRVFSVSDDDLCCD